MSPFRPSRAVLACLSLAMLSQPGSAVPSGEPLPFAAPDKPATAPFDRLATGVVARPDNPALLPFDPAEDFTLLKSGLDAVTARDLAAARAALNALQKSSLDRKILQWAIALSGDAGVSASEISGTMAALPGWPGSTLLARNLEKALFRDRPPPHSVIAALGKTSPRSHEGVTVLAQAYRALGQTGAATKLVSAYWRTAKLEARQEAAFLKAFDGLLGEADHRFRLERMMYQDRIRSAERLAPRLGMEAMVKAWSAVIRGDRNAAALLTAVPEAQRTAGYTMAKAQHLRRSGKYAQAAELVRAAPKDASSLVDPDAWWIERRVLSRELLDLGDVKAAYEVAAGHAAESPVHSVDAEFHAGWYALRGLRDAAVATKHFARMGEIAEGPISLARAYYWLGRASEDAGQQAAKDHFERAATYATSFYGQLAAARLGREAVDIDFPEPSEIERTTFDAREPVRAIRRLEAAGFAARADILYRALAAEIASPGELALLADMASERLDHFLALRIGKAAAGNGLAVGGLSHPVGAIPDSADIDGAGKALAYAIARQESEFNVSAVSHAGARGLLQLLPGTARDMAKRVGLPYSQAKLTTDAAYNATLGAAYLGDQLDRFDGSYILTLIGYNAGPRRAGEWMKRYGDPRGKDIDFVIDWMERIPFTETRSYVQRVMENYQVYKMRLTGKVDIVRDLVEGRHAR